MIPNSDQISGLQTIVRAADKLGLLSGRALQIGCQDGQVLEQLSRPEFDFLVFGVDPDAASVAAATKRLKSIPGSENRVLVSRPSELPFEDNFFSLVCSFDQWHRLDETECNEAIAEARRVVKKGGNLLLTIPLDESSQQNPAWWADLLEADRVEIDRQSKQVVLWKHFPIINKPIGRATPEATTVASDDTTQGVDLVDGHPKDSAELYQRIYDENPWYGDAEQDRCPGVRLLPEYQEWLISPVIDLGCGRGQTVEHLRSAGFEAEGIDQIKVNAAMRVGDITRPIDGIEAFQSAVCVDCIEHLYDDQVVGVFENMKQTRRQAFSIHNGGSAGTGQELHVNRKDFVDWTKLIREHFDIASAIQINDEQVLYLTQAKTP